MTKCQSTYLVEGIHLLFQAILSSQQGNEHTRSKHQLEYLDVTNVIYMIDLMTQRDIHGTSIPHVPYKLLPSIKNILGARCFFSCFIFIARFYHGLAGACVNPGSIFSNSVFVHSLLCQITHSFLNRFQPNLCQHFSLPVMLFSA